MSVDGVDDDFVWPAAPDNGPCADDPIVDERYERHSYEEDMLTIYDSENTLAWVSSTVSFDLGGVR